MNKVKNREFHGLSRTPEYHTWCGMRQRCNNKNSTSYKDYGGRGITVCERWDASFADFIADMGLKPSVNHSIDRIDNDLGYWKENCRWANHLEQANNCRKNLRIEIGGVAKTLAQWSSDTGLKSQVIHSRLVRLGWSAEDLLKDVSGNVLTYKGQSGRLSDLAVIFGFNYDTARVRVGKLGWSLEDAIETPVKFDKSGASLKKVTAFGQSLTLREWSNQTGIKYGTILARIKSGKTLEVALTDALNTRHNKG